MHDGSLQCHTFQLSTHVGDVVEFFLIKSRYAKTALILLKQKAIGCQPIECLAKGAEAYVVVVLQGADGELLASGESSPQKILAQVVIYPA